MSALTLTPWRGGRTPFRIGLHPLDLAHWLDIDDTLASQLREKERLDREAPGLVFMEEAETRAAQAEALALVTGHLRAHHGATHRFDGAVVTICGGRCVALDDALPPLKLAARLVAEDLVLMRRNADGTGWRIAAASLHFPSSWSLAEKFGRALADVHAPVPGFARGTRTATIIDRIFDNLHVDQPVWRTNFSLYDDDLLHHPGRGAGQARNRDDLGRFIRSEYQTLRKLPDSGDILFTIRIHIDPLAALARHPDRAALGRDLVVALGALDAAQLAYKGLDDTSCAALVARITALCS